MNRFSQTREIVDDGLDVLYVTNFIDAKAAKRLHDDLTTEAAWHRPKMRFANGEVETRRQVAWHADPHYVYSYSGQVHEWRPWSPAMTVIREAVEDYLGMTFNGVLLNWYADGSESVAPHADDERDMEPGIPIAAVSLGATRDFVLKHVENGNRHVLTLENGSLTVMRGRTQEVARHSIPKRAGVSESRISLTFRRSTRCQS